jgi:RNA polymerase sigma-70 factor (ECF subfamily)
MGIHQRCHGVGPALVRRQSTTKDPQLQSAAETKYAKERAARIKTARAEAMIDRDLVLRFNRGDEAAFDEIIARHRETIQAHATRFLRNHADAEEITQDTFIRAHRGLATFRGDSSLSTWLHRIAFNLARNRYWYFFRRRRHMTLALDSPLSTESSGTFNDLVASDEPDPAREASVNEFVILVAACMQKLEVSQREILTLRNLLHQSYDEIASALGINLGTVKSRIARARGNLRELLADACPEYSTNATANDFFEPVRGSGRVT